MKARPSTPYQIVCRNPMVAMVLIFCWVWKQHALVTSGMVMLNSRSTIVSIVGKIGILVRSMAKLMPMVPALMM